MEGHGRWSDLPGDVLREISSRVCAATDFVYFHAVCKPWRASRDPMSQRTTSTQFLPWLLGAADQDSTDLRFRCIFSKSSFHGKPGMQPAVAGRNWVSSSDGTKVRYLTVEDLRPTLHDPITGEFTHLPLFPEDVSSHWEEENPSGVIYGDGTTLLYSIWYFGDDVHTARFRAALLRPGSDMWTVFKRTLQVPRSREFCVAYHGGKIMLVPEATLWRVITPDVGDDAGGWSDDERCSWHVPQPTIAPIQELLKVRQLKKQRRQQTDLVTGPTLRIHIRRHYEPSYKLMVRNLPLTMKSSQLQVFLSRHGQVSNAQVLCYKKIKHSQGIALVTMSTLHANPQDALDALNALSFEGYDLQVKFIKEGRQRYQQPRPDSI